MSKDPSYLTAQIANILHENTSLDPGESLVAADLITKELLND